MDNKKVFRVAVIANLNEREWWVLSAATSLTTSRARSYLFERPSENPPDIWLVDGDNPEILRQWRMMLAGRSAPTVFLRANPDPSPEVWDFNRKIVPSCLLKLINLLDQISVQKLHYLPELCIGMDESYAQTLLTGAVTPTTTSQPRYSALVVDDSPTVRAQIGIGLQIFGAFSDFAESAEEAYELLKKNYYDIAFLDVVLPGDDGYQVCKAIKRNPKHKHTVAIMLTSKSSTIDRVKASLAGCNAFITKPVENEQFQEILGKYLGETVAGTL